jgi:hypothetical protein
MLKYSMVKLTTAYCEDGKIIPSKPVWIHPKSIQAISQWEAHLGVFLTSIRLHGYSYDVLEQPDAILEMLPGNPTPAPQRAVVGF